MGCGKAAGAPLPAPAAPSQPCRALPLFLTVLSPAGCQTGEEGRSVGCARRPCTSLRRCSVKATASTSPASCAVSITPCLTPSLLPGRGLLGISPDPPAWQEHGSSRDTGAVQAVGADLSQHPRKNLVCPYSRERPGWVLWSVSRCLGLEHETGPLPAVGAGGGASPAMLGGGAFAF